MKDNGKFAEAGARAVQGELHLHEEGVAFRANGVKVNFLQHLGAVADKASRHVVYGDASKHAGVEVSAETQHAPPNVPAFRTAACYIARADDDGIRLQQLDHRRKQLGRVGEVGVGLDDIVGKVFGDHLLDAV